MKFIPDKIQGRLLSHSMKISSFVHELSPMIFDKAGGTPNNHLVME